MRRPLSSTWLQAIGRAALLGAALLGGRGAALAGKADAPIPAATLGLMSARQTGPAAPIVMRTFKKEAELEIWKLARDGRYVHLKTFPICRWSGQLGPKRKQGDRQTPEGFYSIAPRQMNPNSAYYLSFDTGFPNAYDRAHGSSGSALMVHGTCSSAGCFAMTDRQIGEIYAIARDAFAGGQSAFQFQAFPFRMTAANMAKYRSDPNIAFWRELKEGSDRFEATGEAPVVGVAGGRYVFARSQDPAREAAAVARRAEEDKRVATLLDEGVAAVRISYADGGQHPSFAALARAGASLGDISRPEALILAGREVTVIPARRRPLPCPGAGCPAQVAGLHGHERTGEKAAVAFADAEPALFGAVALGYAGRPVLAATLAGSARILPATLSSGRYEFASRR